MNTHAPFSHTATTGWHDETDDAALASPPPSCLASERESSYMLPQLLSPPECQTSASSWLSERIHAC